MLLHLYKLKEPSMCIVNGVLLSSTKFQTPTFDYVALLSLTDVFLKKNKDLDLKLCEFKVMSLSTISVKLWRRVLLVENINFDLYHVLLSSHKQEKKSKSDHYSVNISVI